MFCTELDKLKENFLFVETYDIYFLKIIVLSWEDSARNDILNSLCHWQEIVSKRYVYYKFNFLRNYNYIYILLMKWISCSEKAGAQGNRDEQRYFGWWLWFHKGEWILPGKKFEKPYESKNYIDFSANKGGERSEDWFLKKRFIRTWKCLTYR